MPTSPTIFWFRRDLRLADNPALVEAATLGDGAVAPVFIVDPRFANPAGPARAQYLRASLEALDETLGGSLIVRYGEPSAELLALARELSSTCVVATSDFAPLGLRRDEHVARALAGEGIDVRFVDSNYVVAPGTITTKSGSPCRVFGAYRRAWEMTTPPSPLEAPRVHWREASGVGLEVLGDASARVRPRYFGDLPDGPPRQTWRAGEVAAHERLADFVTVAGAYGELRDAPGEDSTSRLSPFLRFGALHPRQVIAATSRVTGGDRSFATEICWRDFYADVLFHNPDSVSNVLQPAMAKLLVDRDEAAVRRFQVWARGETGYPLVDAGMRQLLDEGWMHNRVRMVVASFLVKHLHLDWRWGAKWFMWRLIDADLASNQHGWQWTAGTGTDAAPFHRVFNPTLQAERYDPEGVYIRRHVPELASIEAPQCLAPGGGGGLLTGSYPAPMLDLNEERLEALARFAEARSG